MRKINLHTNQMQFQYLRYYVLQYLYMFQDACRLIAKQNRHPTTQKVEATYIHAHLLRYQKRYLPHMHAMEVKSMLKKVMQFEERLQRNQNRSIPKFYACEMQERLQFYTIDLLTLLTESEQVIVHSFKRKELYFMHHCFYLRAC